MVKYNLHIGNYLIDNSLYIVVIFQNIINQYFLNIKIYLNFSLESCALYKILLTY